jgi:predicted permease
VNDLRFACRQLVKSPGFTAVVVLSLALGIGANATVLCWIQNILWRPLSGVARQEELAVLVSSQGSGCVSLADLRDLVQERKAFAGGTASMITSASLTVDRRPEWIEAQIVGADFFELLGVKPVLGRTFLPDEDRVPSGNPVLVISEPLWRRRFGGDPAVLGQVVDLNRHSFTIVGVVPAAFAGTMNGSAFDVWAPLSMIWEVRNQGHYFLTRRDARGWHNVVRLQPGVSLSQAQAALDTRAAQLAASHPDSNRDVRHRLLPLSQCPWGAQSVLGPTLRLLLVVSWGVQLIVVANVANLLLARAAGRHKEVAIRLATGATRLRLLRQFLTESVCLALLGGGLGVLFARWAADAFPLVFLPKAIAANVHLNLELAGATMTYAALLTLVTGSVLGLVPALLALRPNLYAALKEGGRTSQGGVSHHRLRAGLVVAEVALALVLLIGAGLCVQGLRQARRIDVGFDPDSVLLAGLQIGMNGYDPESGKAFYRRARQRLAELPGVEEAALASWFPLGLSGCKGWDAEVEGYQRPPGEDTTYEFAIVSPRYFATLRIPLLAGRDFTDADDTNAPAVAIVNEHFANRFWSGQNPLGRRFRTGGTWRTVVGLAKAGKYNRVDEGPWCFFYLPYQQGVPDLDLGLCVRVRGNPATFVGAVRRAINELDPGVGLLRTLPLAEHAQLALFAQRMASGLLVLLGSMALGLAAMGVYAVMAYAVSQRTQEFGIRMTLGARVSDVVRQVLGDGLRLTALGIAIGLALALALAHLLASFLYGLSPFDPLAFAGVPLLLGLVALTACWLPARRAAKVDPMEALRSE